MWNPFKKRSRADVHNLVIKNAETGLQEIHFIITVNDIADARDAISAAFDSVVSEYRSKPEFGGQIVFVVRGPVPDRKLPPELAAVQSQLDAKLAAPGIQTVAGRPFQVRLEYKESAF